MITSYSGRHDTSVFRLADNWRRREDERKDEIKKPDLINNILMVDLRPLFGGETENKQMQKRIFPLNHQTRSFLI